jgi:hypothetical protein
LRKFGERLPEEFGAAQGRLADVVDLGSYQAGQADSGALDAPPAKE